MRVLLPRSSPSARSPLMKPEGEAGSRAHACQAPDAVDSTSQPSSVKHDSDPYSDSLNTTIKQPKPEKYSLFREVRQNFHRRLAEKLSQTFSSRKPQQETMPPANSVWHRPKAERDFIRQPPLEAPELDFFDSIDNSVDVDQDDSLLINSGYYCHKSVLNEAMAELDSLEVRLHRVD